MTNVEVTTIDHVIFTVLSLLSIALMWLYRDGGRRKDHTNGFEKGAVPQMWFAFGTGSILTFTVLSVSAGVSWFWIIVGVLLGVAWLCHLLWKYPSVKIQ